jgi:hypothetical protein
MKETQTKQRTYILLTINIFLFIYVRTPTARGQLQSQYRKERKYSAKEGDLYNLNTNNNSIITDQSYYYELGKVMHIHL